MSSGYRYTWEVDSTIEIYRERPVKRYLIATLGGYFGVLVKLHDGTLANFVRSGDFHVGERGRIDLVTSADGGKSWSAARPIVTRGPDARNPAAIQTTNGTLLLAYVHAAYVNGRFDPDGGYRTVYLTRSTDNGQSWSAAEPICESSSPGEQLSPYGRMVELADGTILLALYAGRRPADGYASCVLRSRDGGKSWGDRSLIARGFDETALLVLPLGKILAMLRRSNETQRADFASNLWQSVSTDNGYTWSEPRSITGPAEIPGDLLLLNSGNILFTFGHR